MGIGHICVNGSGNDLVGMEGNRYSKKSFSHTSDLHLHMLTEL